MKTPDEKALRAMTPEQRMTLLANARRIGGPEAEGLIRLIDDLGLPLSSGGLSLDHPVYLEMQEIVWSAEGKAAALGAAKQGLPAMAGIDPLLQQRMGHRYGADQQGTLNAGSLVAELMRYLGYKKTKESVALAPGCVAKTAALWT